MTNEFYIYFFSSSSRQMKTVRSVQRAIEFHQAQAFWDTGKIKDRARTILIQGIHARPGGERGQFIVIADSSQTVSMFADYLKSKKLVKTIDYWKLSPV